MDNIWSLVTIAMGIALTIPIMLIVFQIKSFKWYSKQEIGSNIYNNKKELFSLYGVYLCTATCAIQCFLCHISHAFHEWCCVYGMSMCVMLYALTKTLLYFFFLERAKSIQSTNTTDIFKLHPIFTTYILPIYLICYFLVYAIVCPLQFRGKVVEHTHNIFMINGTSCIFGEYEPWIFFVSAAVDAFNSICFMWLFANPLCQMIKSNIIQKGVNDLTKIIRYNIIFSSICSISSVPFLVIMGFAKNNELQYYLWLMGDMDTMINATCTFLMVTANRKYLYYIYATYFKTNTNNTPKTDTPKTDRKKTIVCTCSVGTANNTDNKSVIQTNDIETTTMTTMTTETVTTETIITIPKLNKSITSLNDSTTI